MIVTTLDHVAGRATGDTLGLVRGSATWSRRMLKTYMGGIRHIQAQGLAELDTGMAEARARAADMLRAEAAALGANAVVGLQTEMKELSAGVFLVCVTGTAVRTVRLPAAIPAFGPRGDAFDGEMGLIAASFERAAAEGSALRH